MRYEDIVRKVCGDDWRTVSHSEREGGYGVACVLAFMRGAKPNIGDLANHLGVAADEIVPAYQRLNRSGAFSNRWNVKRDRAMQGHMSDEETQKTWAHIAAVAGGFIGV
jgi:hypothetical protein